MYITAKVLLLEYFVFYGRLSKLRDGYTMLPQDLLSKKCTKGSGAGQ